MTSKDSHKRFGLIGLALIVVAFLVWAFVLPRFDDRPSEQTIDSITTPSATPQEAPRQPITDTPIPPPPAD